MKRNYLKMIIEGGKLAKEIPYTQDRVNAISGLGDVLLMADVPFNKRENFVNLYKIATSMGRFENFEETEDSKWVKMDSKKGRWEYELRLYFNTTDDKIKEITSIFGEGVIRPVIRGIEGEKFQYTLTNNEFIWNLIKNKIIKLGHNNL